jgi:hypothetical protein
MVDVKFEIRTDDKIFSCDGGKLELSDALLLREILIRLCQDQEKND